MILRRSSNDSNTTSGDVLQRVIIYEHKMKKRATVWETKLTLLLINVFPAKLNQNKAKTPGTDETKASKAQQHVRRKQTSHQHWVDVLCMPAWGRQCHSLDQTGQWPKHSTAALVQSANLSLTERLCGTVGELCMNECCEEERTKDMTLTESHRNISAGHCRSTTIAAGWWGELGVYLTASAIKMNNDSMSSVHLRLYNLVGIRDYYI